jgi:phage gp36-like protein
MGGIILSYATPAQLAIRSDDVELYQRLKQNYLALTQAALDDAIAGNDLSGYAADIQAAATDSLARLLALLDDASGEIDGYVMGRYSVPITPAPRGLAAHACNIALYNLYGTTARERDPVVTRYQATLKFLEMLAKGVINIGATDSGEAPAEDADNAEFVSVQSVMGREAYA